MRTTLIKHISFAAVCSILLLLLFSTVSSGTGSSFGEDGVVIKDFGFGDDESLATAVQADGKILVAGYTSNGADKQLFVARYDADGVLDSDFHTGGIFTYGVGGENYTANGLLVQEDGNILIAATGGDSQTTNGYVLQLDTDGYLDKAFASDGIRTVSFSGYDVQTTALAAGSDGRLMVMTSAESSSGTPKVFLSSLTASGSANGDFGEEGVQEVAAPVSFRAKALVLTEAGSLYIAGSAAASDEDAAAVLRAASSGKVDDSFGTDGVALVFGAAQKSSANTVLFDAENEVVWLGGSRQSGDYSEAFVAKLSVAGTLVDDFGNSGVATTDLGYESSLYALAATDDGGVIATGFADSGENQDVFLLVVSSEESTDGSQNGEEQSTEKESSETVSQSVSMTLVDVQEGDDVGYAIATDASGGLYVAGSSSNGENLDASLLLVKGVTGLASSGNSLQAGVTTSGFTIVTLPITEITHTGGITGGQISQGSTSSCDETCSEQCSTSISTDTCYSECYSTCSSETITVTLYGVAYSTKSEPEYNSESDDTDDDTSDTTDDDTTSSTTSIFPQGDLLGAQIVHSGWTEDGSGTGSYESEIADVTPGMKYYVRAFAVLSDGTVVYGNEQTFTTDDGCFIATAAFGSIFADEVRAFRELRDSYLMGSAAGEKLIAVYYEFSPHLAKIIKDHELLRFMTRLLLYPLYLLVCGIQMFGLMAALSLTVFLLITLSAGAVYLRRVQNT